MPLIQGGPPQWVWERTADHLKCEVVPVRSPEGHTVYELRVSCGMEVMRLHFLTREEVREIARLFGSVGGADAAGGGAQSPDRADG